MMKSSFATALLLGVLALLIVTMDISESRVLVRHGNTQKEPLEIVLENYICIESRVPIVELFNSAQAILPNGDTYFFNDVGNVLLWLGRQKDPEKIVVWVYAQDTERYVLAKDACIRASKSPRWGMALERMSFAFMAHLTTILKKYKASHCVEKPCCIRW